MSVAVLLAVVLPSALQLVPNQQPAARPHAQKRMDANGGYSATPPLLLPHPWFPQRSWLVCRVSCTPRVLLEMLRIAPNAVPWAQR
jgi:hypothetical protein